MANYVQGCHNLVHGCHQVVMLPQPCDNLVFFVWDYNQLNNMLTFVQPNSQSYSLGAWYTAGKGVVLYRAVESLAMLPSV